MMIIIVIGQQVGDTLIKIPGFKYVNDVKKATCLDKGIIPEIVIIPTIIDVMLHKDVQLDYALQLANDN